MDTRLWSSRRGGLSLCVSLHGFDLGILVQEFLVQDHSKPLIVSSVLRSGQGLGSDLVDRGYLGKRFFFVILYNTVRDYLNE